MRDFPYTVKDGDSFSKIATVRYGAEKALFSLASYNKIDPKSTLFTGQKLKLPETIFYNDIDAPSNSVVVRQANVILPEVAEHVAGPATAKIGDKSEFTIDRFKTGATADDKANSGWKIEVFFKDGSKKETIEPEKSKPAFVTSTPAKLVVDKIPGSWANGSFQVFPVVRKADPAVSVKTIVGMKPIELSRSKQRPGFYSRTTKSFTDVADDMTVNDFTIEQYKKINLFTTADDLPAIPSVPTPFGSTPGRPAGLLHRKDGDLFNEMESMCTTYFSTNPLEDVVRKLIRKFKDKGAKRVLEQNTRSDAFTDPVLTKAALDHQSMKDFVDAAKDQTIKAIVAASLDANSIKSFAMARTPIFHDASDIRDGLTIIINDTWAYDIDLIDYQLLDAKRFKGKIKISVYDHFGLDKPDLDANLFKPYGVVDGFRAWFILQHLRGYIPFWTVIETEAEFEGSLT
jgi:LysM repeat protein